MIFCTNQITKNIFGLIFKITTKDTKTEGLVHTKIMSSPFKSSSRRLVKHPKPTKDNPSSIATPSYYKDSETNNKKLRYPCPPRF